MIHLALEWRGKVGKKIAIFVGGPGVASDQFVIRAAGNSRSLVPPVDAGQDPTPPQPHGGT